MTARHSCLCRPDFSRGEDVKNEHLRQARSRYAGPNRRDRRSPRLEVEGYAEEVLGQEEGATVVAGVAAALSGDGEQLASPLEQLLVGLGVAAGVTGVLVLPGTGVP